jgi:hypothetical protein
MDYNGLEKWHCLGKESGITELKKFYAKKLSVPRFQNPEKTKGIFPD